MLAILLTALITFFFSTLFGYVVHRSLHRPWTGVFNQRHMTHHLTLYPPSDYLSEKYRDAGKDNTVITFAIVSSPVVATPIVLGILGILPLSLVITAIAMMALVSFLHSYLHDTFHIRDHFFTRLPIIKTLFARWVQLHYLHHVNMATNFGIFLFHWDHLFKSFWDNLHWK